MNKKENSIFYFGRALVLLFFLCIISVFSNRSIKSEQKADVILSAQISNVKAIVTSPQSLVSFGVDKIVYPFNNLLFSDYRSLLLNYNKFLSHKLKAAELNNKHSLKPEIFAEHNLHLFMPIGEEPFLLV